MTENDQPSQRDLLRSGAPVPGGRRFASQQALAQAGVFIRSNRRNPRNQPAQPADTAGQAPAV